MIPLRELTVLRSGEGIKKSHFSRPDVEASHERDHKEPPTRFVGTWDGGVLLSGKSVCQYKTHTM